MVCAGAVSAQFIAGKATRDALYLAQLDVTSLPAMVIGDRRPLDCSSSSLSSRALRRMSPAHAHPGRLRRQRRSC